MILFTFNDTYKALLSLKIDILSIDSSDIVASEVNELITCMIKNRFEKYKPTKLIMIE